MGMGRDVFGKQEVDGVVEDWGVGVSGTKIEAY